MTEPTDSTLLEFCAEVTGWTKVFPSPHAYTFLRDKTDAHQYPLSDLNAAFLVAMIRCSATRGSGFGVTPSCAFVCGYDQIDHNGTPASAARALCVALWKARKR